MAKALFGSCVRQFAQKLIGCTLLHKAFQGVFHTKIVFSRGFHDFKVSFPLCTRRLPNCICAICLPKYLPKVFDTRILYASFYANRVHSSMLGSFFPYHVTNGIQIATNGYQGVSMGKVMVIVKVCLSVCTDASPPYL